MQRKRNVCTNQRLTAKAFLKIILLLPTQSGPSFRVILIKYKTKGRQQAFTRDVLV